MSITHIAHLCGFSSLKQFSDSFRRAEGVTARQFRNEVRN
jgi:AraC-like DNA-binding protein